MEAPLKRWPRPSILPQFTSQPTSLPTSFLFSFQPTSLPTSYLFSSQRTSLPTSYLFPSQPTSLPTSYLTPPTSYLTPSHPTSLGPITCDTCSMGSHVVINIWISVYDVLNINSDKIRHEPVTYISLVIRKFRKCNLPMSPFCWSIGWSVGFSIFFFFFLAKQEVTLKP